MKFCKIARNNGQPVYLCVEHATMIQASSKTIEVNDSETKVVTRSTITMGRGNFVVVDGDPISVIKALGGEAVDLMPKVAEPESGEDAGEDEEDAAQVVDNRRGRRTVTR